MTDEKAKPRCANLHVGAFEKWDDNVGRYMEIGTMWDNTKNSIGTIGTMQGQCHCPTIYDKMPFVQNRSAVDL